MSFPPSLRRWATVCFLILSFSTLAAAKPISFQIAASCSIPRFGRALYDVGGSVTIRETADFNGDGHLDLVGYGEAGGPFRISILKGDGTGAFTAGSSILVRGRTDNLVVIDYNNDGKPDIAVTPNTSQLFIYYNDGQGGFGQPQELTPPSLENTSLNFNQLLVGDVNGDGKPDLLGHLSSAGDTVIFLNGSQNGVNANVKLGIRYALRDFTGDGKLDLLGRKPTPGSPIFLYPGDGQGGFGPEKQTPIVAGSLLNPIVSDINGDGKLDAVGGRNLSQFSSEFLYTIYLGDGAGNFGAGIDTQTTGSSAPVISVSPVVAIDVSGDSKIDLAYSSNRALTVMLGDGAGNFGAPISSEMGILAGLPGDFNEDSKIDLVSGNVVNNRISVSLNRCGTPGLIIAGNITDKNTLRGVGSASVVLSGAGTATTQTDIGGNYLFTNLTTGGPYTITPSRPAHTFEQSSQTVSSLAFDRMVDFFAQRTMVNVSAASYTGGGAAPESIVSAFGVELARSVQTAASLPLPLTLNDVDVQITDSLNVPHLAPLFFISPGQINYLLPSGPALGPAKVRARIAPEGIAQIASVQMIDIVTVAPGLFTANADGRGAPSAVLLRRKANGAETFEPIAVFDQTQNQFLLRPIDMGDATDQLFLILFGTGMRNRTSLSGASAQIGGTSAAILFIGPQTDLIGLDQINVSLPRSLAGRGELELTLTVDGKQANLVRINVK
jgi:uncharacterized protein (TIGR03437 family)